MENISYHVPFYVVNGGIATSGHSADLTAGKVGIFDRATFNVATSIGNGKELFFAQGANGGLDWYGSKVRNSHKSPFFYGKDVENMYLSRPQALVNEEWVIGFNGSPSSKTLKFTTGEALRIKFYFHGQPVYRFFNGPKEYVVSYTPKEDCTEPCTGSDCPDAITDCQVHTKALIDLINNHTELRKFGVSAKFVAADYSAAATNMEKYCISLCDNGDGQALEAVQAQAPTGAKVVRTERTGSQSTYQFCQDDDLGAPTDFTVSGDVDLAICGECPVGSTLTEAKNTYFVNRPLAGSEDLNDSGARQTFADVVGTAYEAAHVVVFNGEVAAVDVGTNIITEVAHGFATGDKVTYSNGGGTSITGITTASDYFVIRLTADTFALATTAALAYAGTKRDLTVVGIGVSHTLTPVITATFVAIGGGVATVKLTVGAGVELAAQSADTVIFANTTGAVCTYSDPTPVAWALCGTGIRSKRTLRIKNLNRPDCDTAGDRLADLELILAGVVGIDLTTLTLEAGDACKDDYTVEQFSVDCLDEGCLTSNVTFTYDNLPAFENESWVVVPPTHVDDATRKCGIRVTAGYIDPKFGDCSFNPMDYYETEPIKMEVSLLQEDGDRCDVASWPTVSQSRIGQISRQSGEFVIRELIMKTDAYLKHIDQFSLEPRMREAFDMNLLSSVDKNAYYNLYYVTYKASYGHSFRKNEQEKFTTVFAFKEGDAAQASFQTNVLNVLTAKSGVVLHVNEANIGGSSGQQS